MDCFDTTSSRRAWLITGNFAPKYSPNGFAISLIHSNHRVISERSARCSKRNQRKATQWKVRRAAQSERSVFYVELLTRSGYRDDEFAVLLGDEILGAAG